MKLEKIPIVERVPPNPRGFHMLSQIRQDYEQTRTYSNESPDEASSPRVSENIATRRPSIGDIPGGNSDIKTSETDSDDQTDRAEDEIDKEDIYMRVVQTLGETAPFQGKTLSTAVSHLLSLKNKQLIDCLMKEF